MKLFLRAMLVVCFVTTPVHAADKAGIVPIQAGPVVIRPDRAYLLLRVDETNSGLAPALPVFLRKPSDAEVADYDTAKKAAYERDLPNLTKRSAVAGSVKPPNIDAYHFTYDNTHNLFTIPHNMSLESSNNFHVYLIEVDPTDYFIYGSTNGYVLDTCNCLGTVGFHAYAGVITDLGTILFDDPESVSRIPELAPITGVGKIGGNVIIATAVRPASKDTAVPAIAAGLARKHAAYYAVGPFAEPGAENIFRLAPIPGVMHYAEGRAVDDVTGHVLPISSPR